MRPPSPSIPQKSCPLKVTYGSFHLPFRAVYSLERKKGLKRQVLVLVKSQSILQNTFRRKTSLTEFYLHSSASYETQKEEIDGKEF